MMYMKKLTCKSATYEITFFSAVAVIKGLILIWRRGH